MYFEIRIIHTFLYFPRSRTVIKNNVNVNVSLEGIRNYYHSKNIIFNGTHPSIYRSLSKEILCTYIMDKYLIRILFGNPRFHSKAE